MKINNQKLRSLLEKACTSCENQACWDKKPWSEWYYEAKRYLRENPEKIDSPTWDILAAISMSVIFIAAVTAIVGSALFVIFLVVS